MGHEYCPNCGRALSGWVCARHRLGSCCYPRWFLNNVILGIPDVKDLVAGNRLRTDSFLSVAVGKQPKACKTEESLKGE